MLSGELGVVAPPLELLPGFAGSLRSGIVGAGAGDPAPLLSGELGALDVPAGGLPGDWRS